MPDHIVIKNQKSGKEYAIYRFNSYIVDQSLAVPADFFNFSLNNNDSQVSDKITSGDEVWFYINDTLALNGIIDDVEIDCSTSSNNIEITGRDKSSLLIDNDALPKTFYKLNLQSYLQQVCPQYGITKFKVDNSEVFDKITVNPGDNEWSVIEDLCKKKGLYPRYDGDMLVCTKLRADTSFNYHFSNDLPYERTIRFKNIKVKVSGDVKSEIIVYGGHYTRGEYTNKNNIKGFAKDSNLKILKRRVINDDDLENNLQATNKAKSELKEINRGAFTIELELYTKQPIFINKIAKVTVKQLKLDCFMLVDSVQYRKSMEGSTTIVKLKLIEGVSVNWGNHSIPIIQK